MPAFDSPSEPAVAGTAAADSQIPFPPVTRDHILHCSYDFWFPKYRASCIQSRIIQLPPDFIEYIREDGIILSSDQGTSTDEEEPWTPTESAHSFKAPPPDQDSDSDDDDEPAPPRLPPNERFPVLHQNIKDTIQELGGAVVPKLNWSSPKDATWISVHQNTLKCETPDDIYLLLKSSNFVSHDLEHAFDGCIATPPSTTTTPSTSGLGFQPVLVLRSFFNPHQALEFRCFVKQRNLVAISQRDLNHYDFLETLRPNIIARVKQLFDNKLRFTFPDGNFSFDVFIPEVHNINTSDSDSDEDEWSRLDRARLIDINPWAPRTDALLFFWKELLELEVPRPMLGVTSSSGGSAEAVVHLHFPGADKEAGDTTEDDDTISDDDNEDYEPELRLVGKDGPSAYNYMSPQYSAHKMPKEVVDASAGDGGGLREFAQAWERMQQRR